MCCISYFKWLFEAAGQVLALLKMIFWALLKLLNGSDSIAVYIQSLKD